jgi:hypothetical protein
MPLTHYSLEAVRDALRVCEVGRLGRVLSFGHPDVVMKPQAVAALFGLSGPLPVRPDSAQIINWHNAHRLTDGIVDTTALFKALGYELTAFDVTEARGGETLVDLNRPVPETFHRGYDLVYDNVSHQCFNLPQAMATAALCARVGGFVVHVTPLTMANNGYYNPSPCLYHDFYAANGFDLVRCEGVEGIYTRRQTIRYEAVKRMHMPDDVLNLVAARKREHVEPVVFPFMTKFKVHPTFKLKEPK